MILEELLIDIENNQYTLSKFTDYVKSCGGVDNIKREDMDKILEKSNYELLTDDVVFSVYKMVREIDSIKQIEKKSSVMEKSTVRVGQLTILSTVIALIALIISIVS